MKHKTKSNNGIVLKVKKKKRTDASIKRKKKKKKVQQSSQNEACCVTLQTLGLNSVVLFCYNFVLCWLISKASMFYVDYKYIFHYTIKKTRKKK